MSDPKTTRPKITHSLERFETRLQTLLEDHLERLLEGRLKPKALARKLGRALEESIRKENHVLFAPDLFVVSLNPEDVEDLMLRYNDVADRLAEQLATLAADLRLTMNQRPRVLLVSDPGLPVNRILVHAEHSAAAIEKTQQMEQVTLAETARPLKPREASLVINGRQHVPLDRPVLNIGRQVDNHLVLDDKRVSRKHCQLRLRFGRYVIYDLGSRGGTRVNGQSIKEHILKAGDVISLAGYELVYVEDPPTSEFSTQPTHSSDTAAMSAAPDGLSSEPKTDQLYREDLQKPDGDAGS